MTGMEQDILNYLLEHPDANDTVDGIARWWILEQRIKREMAQVRSSLDGLEDKGWILARRGPDNVAHYRLNPERKSEIVDELARRSD